MPTREAIISVIGTWTVSVCKLVPPFFRKKQGNEEVFRYRSSVSIIIICPFDEEPDGHEERTLSDTLDYLCKGNFES